MLSHSYTITHQWNGDCEHFQVQIIFQEHFDKPAEVWIKLSTPPISGQHALAPEPQPNDHHPQKLLNKKTWQVIG